MDLLIVLAIVMFVIFGNIGKKAQKEQQRRQGESGGTEDRQMSFDTSGDYKAFREPTKESQKASWHSTRRATTTSTSTTGASTPVRTNRMMPKTDNSDNAGRTDKTVISDRAQDIQERRISQHENAKKKRIHQNIHREDEKETEITPSDLMHNIRDLIVCGYPTEIKEQRDFIKEGEDFLNSLSGDSLFF